MRLRERAVSGLKRFLKALVTGVWKAWPGRRRRRGASRRPEASVRILCYHRLSETPCCPGSELEVAPAVFAEQMACVAAMGYRVVPLSRVPGILRSQSDPAGGPGDGPYLVITFDDGYRDNLRALPVLARHAMTATFFVAADFAGSGAAFPWTETIDQDPEVRPLSWDEIKTVALAGHEIHSHGLQHIDLTRADRTTLDEETAGSRRAIAEQLGLEPSVFCFPFGHLNGASVEAAAAAGYEAACTLAPGLNRPATSPYRLRRTVIKTTDSLPVFRAKLEGAFDWPRPALLMTPLRLALAAILGRRSPETARREASP